MGPFQLAASLETDGEVSAADIGEIRDHPGFRAAVEAYAAANLARYSGLSLVERWLISDMGRASLSGSVAVLDSQGLLTAASFMNSPPIRSGEVSRGRARLYLHRAMANGLIAAVAGDATPGRNTPLAPTPRFRAVMTGVLSVGLLAVSRIAPEVAPALSRLEDVGFLRRASFHVGRLLAAQNLFPLDLPVRLFQGRDGGTRMLEVLIQQQAPDRVRLLGRCRASRSALARAGFVSRAHVIQTLRDGLAAGLLETDGRWLIIAPALSDDATRYYATLFAVTRRATLAALSDT